MLAVICNYNASVSKLNQQTSDGIRLTPCKQLGRPLPMTLFGGHSDWDAFVKLFSQSWLATHLGELASKIDTFLVLMFSDLAIAAS